MKYLILVSLLPCFAEEALATLEEKCPSGWRRDGSARSCYYVSSRHLTQPQAHQYCRRLHPGAHLLRVECHDENSLLADLLAQDHAAAWIDARARFDIVDSSAGLFSPGFVFRWPNGKMVRFARWAKGQGVQAVSRDYKCVQVTKDGKWQNAECQQTARVICEKKLRRSYDKLCPKHWVYFNHTASCYRALTDVNMTMLSADDRCFQLGYDHNQDAMLTSINSKEENEFVMNLSREKKRNFDFVMLGGFGRSNNGDKWHWIDGHPWSFKAWDRGMPFGRRSLAVLAMNRRGRWTNQHADKILSQFDAVAVCKFKP